METRIALIAVKCSLAAITATTLPSPLLAGGLPPLLSILWFHLGKDTPLVHTHLLQAIRTTKLGLVPAEPTLAAVLHHLAALAFPAPLPLAAHSSDGAAVVEGLADVHETTVAWYLFYDLNAVVVPVRVI